MADVNRSVSACLRCRRLKLKCGGPGSVPCQRCRTAQAQCQFVAPRAARSRAARNVTSNSTTTAAEGHGDRPDESVVPLGSVEMVAGESNERTTLESLERRLEMIEQRHRQEMNEMKMALADMRRHQSLSSGTNDSQPRQSVVVDTFMATANAQSDGTTTLDMIQGSFDELYTFFYDNCRSIIAFIDDQEYEDKEYLRSHPFMSCVICLVASRAIKPERYQAYLAKAEDLVKQTFTGPAPDHSSVMAMMLLSAWAGRPRLWSYITSIAIELGLNIAALRMADDKVEQSEETVRRARMWFSLCCFDLITNLNRPSVINRLKDYGKICRQLLTSPFRRPVDYRICAYIDSFLIAADAKAQIHSSLLYVSPLPQNVKDLIDSFNQRTESWFYEINNSIDPLYQTFSTKQDRNRFMMAYAFLNIYINGFVLHGIEVPGALNENYRINRIRHALDSACLLIRNQLESESFRRALRYSIDYNGMTTYLAISFILRSSNYVHEFLNVNEGLNMVRQAAQMFEEAGAVDAANELRLEVERITTSTRTVLSPRVFQSAGQGVEAVETGVLFDIPSFLDEATWNNDFPTIYSNTMDW